MPAPILDVSAPARPCHFMRRSPASQARPSRGPLARPSQLSSPAHGSADLTGQGGASSPARAAGSGLASAHALAAEGCRVVAVRRTAGRLQAGARDVWQTVAVAASRVLAVAADVSHRDGVAGGRRRARSRRSAASTSWSTTSAIGRRRRPARHLRRGRGRRRSIRR